LYRSVLNPLSVTKVVSLRERQDKLLHFDKDSKLKEREARTPSIYTEVESRDMLRDAYR
jgi:hypothetical protein